jgi:hypothetical protein
LVTTVLAAVADSAGSNPGQAVLANVLIYAVNKLDAKLVKN